MGSRCWRGLSAGHDHDFPFLPPHTTQTFNSEPQLPKLLLFPEYKVALPPVVFKLALLPITSSASCSGGLPVLPLGREPETQREGWEKQKLKALGQ